MKKIAALLLCLVFAGGVGAYLYLTWPPPAGGQSARYLPPDALAAVRLTHLNELADRYPNSPLGRFTARDPVHAMLVDLHADRETVARYDEIHDTVARVMTNPAFRAVFGEDATLAVLPPDPNAFANDPAATLRRSLVIVAATQASAALDLVGRLAPGANITRESVDGLELTRVVLDDGQTVFAHVDGGSVLFAYEPAVIGRCLEVRRGEVNLQEAPVFQEAAAFWEPYAAETTFARAYVNTRALGPLLQNSAYPDLKEAGDLLQGVDYGVSVSRLTDRGVEMLARSRHGYDRLHQVVRSSVDAAAAPNHSLHLLQEQSLAYNWSASLRPETLAQALADDGQNTAKARETFGVSLEDLGRAVGPQYGLVLNGITAGGLFPIPRMTLFLGVRDRAVAETALAGLRRKVAGYGLAVGSRNSSRAGPSTPGRCCPASRPSRPRCSPTPCSTWPTASRPSRICSAPLGQPQVAGAGGGRTARSGAERAGAGRQFRQLRPLPAAALRPDRPPGRLAGLHPRHHQEPVRFQGGQRDAAADARHRVRGRHHRPRPGGGRMGLHRAHGTARPGRKNGTLNGCRAGWHREKSCRTGCVRGKELGSIPLPPVRREQRRAQAASRHPAVRRRLCGRPAQRTIAGPAKGSAQEERRGF